MEDPTSTLQETLETARLREVVGVATDFEMLEQAVNDLTIAGFDRSDIDLMASYEAVRNKLSEAYRVSVGAVEPPQGARRAIVTRDDKSTTTALVFGTLLTVGAMGASLPILASGGALALAMAAAAGGGLVSAGIAKILRDRITRAAPDLESELANQGLILVVRVKSAENECKAQEIMLSCNLRDVHTHEVEIKKSIEDIPLAKLLTD